MLKPSNAKMLAEESAQTNNYELAERCRKALEEHYGGTVPMPKDMSKRIGSKKESKLLIWVAAFPETIEAHRKHFAVYTRSLWVGVFHAINDSFTPMRKWITENDTHNY